MPISPLGIDINMADLDELISDDMLAADRERRAAWLTRPRCRNGEAPHTLHWRDDEVGWTNCAVCFAPVDNVDGVPARRCVVTSSHGRCEYLIGHTDHHYSYGIWWRR